MKHFTLSATAIEPDVMRPGLRASGAGAYVEFQGWVRDQADGRDVVGLEYQAYEVLANSEGERVIEEALARFPIAAAACVHRTGALAVGECAVWVGVSAAHRDAAFAACRYIIDEIKRRVPIWKREAYADGDSGWVHPAA
jgi:molybdopterin synthase catalytic subunit